MNDTRRVFRWTDVVMNQPTSLVASISCNAARGCAEIEFHRRLFIGIDLPRASLLWLHSTHEARPGQSQPQRVSSELSEQSRQHSTLTCDEQEHESCLLQQAVKSAYKAKKDFSCLPHLPSARSVWLSRDFVWLLLTGNDSLGGAIKSLQTMRDECEGASEPDRQSCTSCSRAL